MFVFYRIFFFFVCLSSFSSFCMWVYSKWRAWNVPWAFQTLAWALTGELSGVWVVEMAGGFETEAGGSHQTSLEDEGEGDVAVWRCPLPSPGRSRGGGRADQSSRVESLGGEG